MAARKVRAVGDVVDGEVVENLFASLVESVRVPEPLVVVPGKLTVAYPPARRVHELLSAVSLESQMRAVFGDDDYEVGAELFGNQPIGVWNKFMEVYNEHMFGEIDKGK